MGVPRSPIHSNIFFLASVIYSIPPINYPSQEELESGCSQYYQGVFASKGFVAISREIWILQRGRLSRYVKVSLNQFEVQRCIKHHRSSNVKLVLIDLLTFSLHFFWKNCLSNLKTHESFHDVSGTQLTRFPSVQVINLSLETCHAGRKKSTLHDVNVDTRGFICERENFHQDQLLSLYKTTV